jgi:hypothetical protein
MIRLEKSCINAIAPMLRERYRAATVRESVP